MTTLTDLARSSARVAAHEALINAVRMLNQREEYLAAMILTDPKHWNECIRVATEQVTASLPKEEPPSKLPKTWPFPEHAERALI